MWNWLIDWQVLPAQECSAPALASLAVVSLNCRLLPSYPLQSHHTLFDLSCPLIQKDSMRMPGLPFTLLPKGENLQGFPPPCSLAAVFWDVNRRSSDSLQADYGSWWSKDSLANKFWCLIYFHWRDSSLSIQKRFVLAFWGHMGYGLDINAQFTQIFSAVKTTVP